MAEIIAPCKLCRTVTEVRPYGHNDSLICVECAQEVNPEAVQAVVDEEFRKAREAAVKSAAMLQALAECFPSFIDPKNPTSTSIH